MNAPPRAEQCDLTTGSFGFSRLDAYLTRASTAADSVLLMQVDDERHAGVRHLPQARRDDNGVYAIASEA